MTSYHKGTTGEVLDELKTSKKGLSEEEASIRVKKYGLNKLMETKRKSLFIKFIEQFKDLTLIILLIAAFISLTALRVIGCIPIAADNTALFNTLVSICTILGAFSSINMGLAVFNLLPIPPLDGSRILTLFLPQDKYFGIMKYERYIFGVLFIVVFLGLLDKPLAFLQNVTANVLWSLTNWVDLIANLFIKSNIGVI